MKLDTLFENFDFLMDSPNSTVKMRKLILQLAIQGKLVDQDPNDEPASELLKRIKSEKEKLIAAGKIKKQKPLPPINKDEIPYELPDGWELVRLGDISNRIGSGSTPRGGKNAYTGSGIPFLRSQNIWDHGLELSDVAHIPEEIHQKMSNTVVQPNDVLLNITGASLGRCTIYPDGLGEANVSQHVTIIRPTDAATSFYLHLCILSPYIQELVWGRQVGMAREGLSKKVLELFEIPLPPLEEQKRIVAKVDQLMHLCDQLDDCQKKAATKYELLNDAALEKLLSSKTIDEFANYWQFLCNNFDLIYNDPAHVNKLRQAILQLAVQGKLAPQDLNDEPASELLKRIKAEKEKLIAEGKIKKQKPLLPISEDEIPYELPQGWTWVRLGEIGLTQTGSTPPTSKREYYGNDYAFIKPADISGKGVRYEGGVGLSKKGIEKGRFVKAYSILMVCIGGSIGKVNFVDRDCSCNQQINAVTPYNDVDFCIVNYNLASPYFQNQVLTNAPSTTLPILSKGKWENIPFPLPPLAEQKRIVSKVDQLMQLCDELETRLNQSKKYSEMLMQAVLHEAFS